MKISLRFAFLTFAATLVSSCSTTKISGSHQYATGNLERPETVWVYAFAATPEELRADSALANHVDPHLSPQTIDHITEGRTLSHTLAGELTSEIRAMGMPGALAHGSTVPQVGDLLVVGSILSFDEGSATKRLAIGFGAGKSSISAAAETFVVTPGGLRELGSGTIDSGSKKSPGAALGLATMVATENPAGLILSTSTKLYGEITGHSKVQGRAEDTAKEIAKSLEVRFKDAGWIN